MKSYVKKFFYFYVFLTSITNLSYIDLTRIAALNTVTDDVTN